MLKIQQLRLQAKLTQAELAAKMQVDQSSVAKWENADGYPRAQMLPKLAKLFHCTIDDLFDQCEEDSHTRGCVKPGA